MCGWCLEGMALEMLEKTRRGAFPSMEIDDGCGLEPYFYLREASDFPKAFEKLMRRLARRRIVSLEKLPADVVILRAVELLAVHGFRSDTYQRLLRQHLFRRLITKACGTKLRERFLGETVGMEVEPLAVLYSADTFLDETCAIELGKVAGMLPSCKRLLGQYYSWWLDGTGVRKNDFGYEMEGAGIVDLLDDTSTGQHERFDCLLRAIYFAILAAGKYQAASRILLKLAQAAPLKVPLFSGDDLWLQRIAALKLYDMVGFDRFLEFLPDLRATHFQYIDLVRNFTPEEKELVRDKFLRYPESIRNDNYITIEAWLYEPGPP
ncbi:MAG: hypothetical protein EG828_03785 [Deltaproteobacteria bacterium]|nr:hypothetical protein [Deltaproteobacteria bacterium]